MTQPEQAPGTVSGWFSRARQSVRGLALAVLATPMLADAFSELAFGRLTPALAAAGGTALVIAAILRLRRARDRRSTWQAGAMVGLAAGLVAHFGADYALAFAGLFGLGAAFGTVLAYGPAKEAVLPQVADIVPPAPPPPPPPPPPLDPEAQAFASLDAQVTALAALPLTLPRGEFAGSVARVAAQARTLLDEARADPADFSRIRRFLGIYLDQLETLAVRYRAAHPAGGPIAPGLATVLAELERAFEVKLAELRAHDLKALDIEREVLARRLAEQLAPMSTPPRTVPQESSR